MGLELEFGMLHWWVRLNVGLWVECIFIIQRICYILELPLHTNGIVIIWSRLSIQCHLQPRHKARARTIFLKN